MLRSTASPTRADLHWIAGFMEGEGSFMRKRSGRATSKKSGDVFKAISVCAAQVQREPLERLQKWLGGHVRFRPSKIPTQSDCYSWGVFGARARGVAMTLYPLMSPKRQGQIRVALGVIVR